MADQEVVDRGDNFAPTTIEKEPEKVANTIEELKNDPEVKEVVEKGEEKAETTEEKPKKGDFIPRDRFNEAVQKERAKAEAAQARAKDLEAQLVTQKVTEDVVEAQKAVKDLIKQRNSLLADGDLDKAGEVDEKIFAMQEAIAERKAEAKATALKEATKEEVRYDAVVSRLEAEYPQINPEAEEYDADSVAEIRALMRGYQAEMGLTPSAALARATKRVFGAPVAAKTDDKIAEDAGVRRKQEATERNVKAAAAQPASQKDVGLDHDKKGGGLDAKTVMKMSYSEFSKLGEDVLAKMRGDTF
jgi:hypothetical protein